MSIGIFTDKKHLPEEKEIEGAIGYWLPAWNELIQHIRVHYPSEEDFKFMYGKNYGWARRFRMRSQLLTNLYPASGSFTVQINLTPEAVEKALKMEIGGHIRSVIEKAHPYPEGRWLFIPIQSPKDIDDIHLLLHLRVESKGLEKK